MIIYGSRATHVTSAQIPFATCPACGDNRTFLASVFARYAHVFWIPFFPIGKVTVAECEHCKKTLAKDEMPERLKTAALAIQSDSNTPKWTFAGLGLMGLIIVFSSISGSQHEKEKPALMASPMVGDKYEYKLAGGTYSILKVARVTRDSVYVFPNQYEIAKSYKLYKIDEDKNYSQEEDGYSKAELLEKFKSGDITDVKRP
ncbi:hypothetical protein [Fibrella aquatilis]|uniref:Zinc-ribbon 15 domain-containing protein n=1 Tax=Fibrella aquatilis TaxID=2817059 RepID=A0A939G937_9BACT|nr:hypothetical protein [Fibrella aquatilis]MBO0934096.1 hypothetical protein [Fibrella aquatilis]